MQQVGKFQFYGYYGGIAIEKNTALDANGTTLIGWGYNGSSQRPEQATRKARSVGIHTLWRDAKFGALQNCVQYAYFFRDPWYVYIAAGAPKNAHQNAIWFDLDTAAGHGSDAFSTEQI